MCYALRVSKQQKPKSGQSRNDARKNGKAAKNPDGRRHEKHPQDGVSLVLMGKGLYRQVSDRAAKNTRRPAALTKRQKDSDD